MWILGLKLHHAYAAATACHPASSVACADLVRIFNGMGNFLANGIVLQAVPALIGAFVEVPVLARELETGTFRCVARHGYMQWTSYQPASRFRPFQWIESGWLLALSLLLIAAAGSGGAAARFSR